MPDNDPDGLAEEFRDLMKNEDAACFLKYADNVPIAFAQCQLRHDYVEGTDSSPVGYLEGIFVEEGYRRKGYAAELLAECEKWAKEKGCAEFASDCELDNADSRKFHLAAGFKETNRIVCFKKELFKEADRVKKNDNPHALRFLESMAKHGEQEAAERFAAGHPLEESADINETFEWAKCVCGCLDERYDDEKIKAIRMDCACGPEPGDNSNIKSLYDKETDPYIFVEKTNELDLGFSLEYDGEAYYLIYPQCYCPCVKSEPKRLSRAWCYCTLGYAKRMFEEIFGTEVHTELLSSVILGDDNCRIRIIKNVE